MRHNKEKPIPFASPPTKIHRTSQNQSFKFYLQMLQNKENTKPLEVNELFVIIREVQTPSFKANEKFMEALDKIFLLLESKQFDLCQNGLNSLILKTETSDKSLSKLTTEKVSYLSYLKALFFDLDGDYQKSLYFYNEALLKLRKFPETGSSSNVYYGMGCLFFNHKKINLACKCFLKAKSIRDQYSQDEEINTSASTHHSSFLLNNIACCLVHFSNIYFCE
jgi:tetratricopeptide (TPR) repeat protein